MPATPLGAARLVRTPLTALLLTCLIHILGLASATAATVTVQLSWTAPGDDGLIGRAAAYELRWSASPINNANVLSASRVLNLRTPSPAGARDSISVTVPVTGAPIYFVVRTADAAGNWSGVSNNATLPGTTAQLPDTLPGLALSRPVPNPASRTTSISFVSPSEVDARVEVYDMSGRRVRSLIEGPIGRGRHTLRWDLSDQHRVPVPAGVYLVNARVGTWTQRQRVAVVR